MKYIIVEDSGIECPIIFSELLIHADVAKNKKVVSAGFCSLVGLDGVVEIDCYGQSQSLGLKSRGDEDALLILKHLKLKI